MYVSRLRREGLVDLQLMKSAYITTSDHQKYGHILEITPEIHTLVP